MKKLLSMLAVLGIIFFACGTKDGDSTANVSSRGDRVAFTKANKLAETAKKELKPVKRNKKERIKTRRKQEKERISITRRRQR